MKIFLILFSFVLYASAGKLLAGQEWQSFKKTHRKFYRSLIDEQRRYSVFQDNLNKIEEHNTLYEKGLTTYKLGVNKFADLTGGEFKEFLTLKNSQTPKRKERNIFKAHNNVEVPGDVDWRQKGAVTGIKDQGECGACWVFSVTGSLEGQYYRKFNQLISFSEQQLVDCAGQMVDVNGCDGGQLDPGFEYIRAMGIETESVYPYEMIDDQCKFNNNSVVTKIEDYVDVEPNNEDALVIAVGSIGPVSVAIDAEFIQFYRDGLYDDKVCSQTEVNHAVLAVGYGSENGNDYWIVKNSWGRQFGKDGYIYMKRGVNQCGIALQPSYPVL